MTPQELLAMTFTDKRKTLLDVSKDYERAVGRKENAATTPF